MVQRGEDLGFALEARQPVGIGRERLGEHLQRHVPVELGVAGLIHLTHAAFADLGGDLVDAEARAGTECHRLLLGMWEPKRIIRGCWATAVEGRPVVGTSKL